MTDPVLPVDSQEQPAVNRTALNQDPPALAAISPDFLWHSLSPMDQPAVILRELISLALIIVICDLTIYRGRGYAGLGLLFLSIPALLMIGIVQRKFERSAYILAPLLVLTSLRMVWCGSAAAAIAGFALLTGFAMTLSGLRPFVIQGVVFIAHLISAGHRGLHHYSQSMAKYSPRFLKTNWAAVLLPFATLLVFGTIFILANPDLVKSFHSGLTHFIEWFEWARKDVQPLELVFWMGIGWLAVGLLRPDVRQVSLVDESVYVSVQSAPAPLYDAFRNTLVMVISLFAAYLIFEFQTLWFREFPQGFYYSGYAHEGAAWLTVALALATLLLSMIFRGRILDDPRQTRLRQLAWIWSIENLFLAGAVFNRLFIYVGFNGMTRMRVVGMLGVASVVGGFLLVLRKIARNHDFVWLIRRQLWTVSFAAYLYTVLPVDAFVNSYNVRRVLRGDPAPSVQISVHPTSAEGYLQLEPLIHCDNKTIRQGIRAMLDEKLRQAHDAAVHRQARGWTAYQLAEDRLLEQLQAASSQWENDEDRQGRAGSLEDFRKYAYQWY